MKATFVVANILAIALTGCSDATKFKAEAEAAKAAQARAEAKLAKAMSQATNVKVTPETESPDLAQIQIKTKEERADEDKRNLEQEVKRQLEANKREREDRLTELAIRKQTEIPPLKQEVAKIQGQIATLDRNMEKLRAQQRSLPPSFGVPTGSKFQPTITRELRDIETQARQRSEAIEKEYVRLRAEYLGKLRIANDRFQKKCEEFEKERQKFLGEF